VIFSGIVDNSEQKTARAIKDSQPDQAFDQKEQKPRNTQAFQPRQSPILLIAAHIIDIDEIPAC
jgi:hypothetical protein